MPAISGTNENSPSRVIWTEAATASSLTPFGPTVRIGWRATISASPSGSVSLSSTLVRAGLATLVTTESLRASGVELASASRTLTTIRPSAVAPKSSETRYVASIRPWPSALSGVKVTWPEGSKTMSPRSAVTSSRTKASPSGSVSFVSTLSEVAEPARAVATSVTGSGGRLVEAEGVVTSTTTVARSEPPRPSVTR